MNINVTHVIESEKILPVIKKYRLGIEVEMFGSPLILDNIEEYNEAYKEEIKGIKEISFHGPFVDPNPGSRDLKIRELTMSRFNCTYNLALEYGAKV